MTNEAGVRERIERLIERVILEQNRLDVNDTLPNVLLDRSSIAIDEEFTCQDGEVVAENECVPCPSGTYFNPAGSRSGSGSCDPCPVGTYNGEIGQLQCQLCPTFQVLGANNSPPPSIHFPTNVGITRGHTRSRWRH